MQVQLKKGILDTVVLAVLIEGNSYGYKIVQDVSYLMDISESTLYPILRRLEKSGCLTTYSKEYNGRLRKYYSITDSGVKRVDEFLAEWKELNKIYLYILNRRTT